AGVAADGLGLRARFERLQSDPPERSRRAILRPARCNRAWHVVAGTQHGARAQPDDADPNRNAVPVARTATGPRCDQGVEGRRRGPPRALRRADRTRAYVRLVGVGLTRQL